MLSIHNFTCGYGSGDVLHGINLTVNPGEITALIGANGAGKTTVLMAISGILSPRSGKIIFKDTDITGMQAGNIVRLGIIQVPEGRRIFPLMTVEENLLLGAFLRKDRREVNIDLRKIYDMYPILYERRHLPGGSLSGGEQQMLAVSRALMAKPELLLLDEPSLGLAPRAVKQIFSIIRELNRNSRTAVLLVEQNAHMALSLAHSGYVIENGRVTLSGSAENLRGNESVRAAYFGGR